MSSKAKEIVKGNMRKRIKEVDISGCEGNLKKYFFLSFFLFSSNYLVYILILTHLSIHLGSKKFKKGS